METIAITAILVASGVLFSKSLARHSITLPMIFTLGGLIVGERVLGYADLTPDIEVGLTLAKLTLAFLLFSDASTLRWSKVRSDNTLAGRLVFISLPLSIALGGLLAYAILPNENFGLVLLIGAALAPTDAALSLPVFTNPNIPARIRDALNVESGLNDGVATPFVALFLGIAIAESPLGSGEWISHTVKEIGIAIIVGVVIGIVGGSAIRFAAERNLTSSNMAQLAFLALAIAAFFGSSNLQGSGVIAAFIAGLFCGSMMGDHTHHAAELTETLGVGGSLMVWAMFGASMVPLAVDDMFTWRAVIFALIALTVMRMVPVAVAFRGSGLRRDTIAIMGWFGPRGLASVVFLLIAMMALREVGESTDTLVAAITWTIGLSIILHGVSASVLAEWYGRRIESSQEDLVELKN